MKLVVLSLLGLWCLATPSQGATIYVSANASGTEDGTQQHPYSNFKAALDDPSITSGTVVSASPGTYTGDDNTNLEVNPSLSLVFAVTPGVDGDVIIDLGGDDVGFLKVTSVGLPFDVDGYFFINQAVDSTTPILSFDSTDETTLSACTFKDVGFAVSMTNVQAMTIHGSTFKSCLSKDLNGPCLFCQDTAGSIVSTHFEDSQGHKGGAIYIDDTPTSSVVQLLFVNLIHNTAEKSGGGLYIALGNVSVVSSTFTNNTAMGDDGSGGGLYSEVPVTLTATVFEYNTAGKVGGGVALESSPSSSSSQLASSNFKSLQVNDNTAPKGGGIHLASLSPVFLSNSQIINNVATDEDSGKGGGVYLDSSSDIVTIDDTTIAMNSAIKGGGLYIDGPSSSTLIQVRAGCIIEKNIASESGGGVELGGPVVYAGFSGSSIDYNVANGDSSTGGGLMLSGTAVVSDCLVEGNVAENGGGIEVDHSGLITFIDNTITLNNATANGGGIRITTSSGVLLKGGSFTGNNGVNGAGVFIGPSLPAEFASVAFDDNSASKSGGAIYLSGTSQESITGVSLVTIRNCDFFDTFNEAVYSTNGGEMVLDQTCFIPGLHLVSESSVSVCGCSSGASITNLQMESSTASFLTDSSFQATGNFAWKGGDIYGVDSTTCMTGLKSGFTGNNYSIDTPPTLTVTGTGLVGSGSDTLTSRDINWVISQSINLASDLLDVGDSSITVDGRFTLTESQTVQCGSMYNYGTLQLEQGSLIEGTLVQKGTMEIRYSTVPDEDTTLAKVTNQEIEGGEIKVYAPSPTPLSEGDSFAVLSWGRHTGSFSSLDLKSSLEDKTKGELDYLASALKINIVYSGGDAGAIVGIVIAVLIVVAIVGAGVFYYFRKRNSNSYGELESPSHGFGEGTTVLGGES